MPTRLLLCLYWGAMVFCNCSTPSSANAAPRLGEFVTIRTAADIERLGTWKSVEARELKQKELALLFSKGEHIENLRIVGGELAGPELFKSLASMGKLKSLRLDAFSTDATKTWVTDLKSFAGAGIHFLEVHTTFGKKEAWLSEFGKLSGLREFRVSLAELERPYDAFLEGWESLESLTLVDECLGLSEASYVALGKLQKLREFHAWGASLTQRNASGLAESRSLRALSFMGGTCEDEALRKLTFVRGLEKLKLGFMDMTDTDVATAISANKPASLEISGSSSPQMEGRFLQGDLSFVRSLSLSMSPDRPKWSVEWQGVAKSVGKLDALHLYGNQLCHPDVVRVFMATQPGKLHLRPSRENNPVTGSLLEELVSDLDIRELVVTNLTSFEIASLANLVRQFEQLRKPVPDQRIVLAVGENF